MDVSESSLVYRVAGSARDLARSTLSGIEEDMTNPEAGKLGESSTRTTRSDESKSTDRRPNLYSRMDSFRTESSATASNLAEEDFDQFQAQNDFENMFQSLELSGKSPVFDCDHYNENPSLSQNAASSMHRDSLASFAPTNTKHSTNTNVEVTKNSIAPEVADGSGVDTARSAALRRLNQIGSHLQRNLAMQADNQDLDVQSQIAANAVLAYAQQEAIRQDAERYHQLSRTEGTKSASKPQISNLLHHTHRPATRPKSPQRRGHEEETENSEFSFHCPFYACHRNLRRMEMDTVSSGQKQCVHIGCEAQAQTRKDWMEHVASPHHDLQGSFLVRG